MKKIKVLIADDEPLARERLAGLLSSESDVELVAQARDGEEAATAIHDHSPDLVFLDVQMPDLDGFEVLKAADVERLPAVVFVTAYDKYALRAFEACAVDYLLKPYESDRFSQAVDRALRWIGQPDSAEQEERLRRLLQEVMHDRAAAAPGAPEGRLDRFMVKRGGRAHFVRAEDVDWIESDGNYVSLHVGPHSHLVRGTIIACAQRLDPRRFVRIHRRYIVNIDRVKEIQPWFGGDYIVLLHNGHKLRLSRNFRGQFQSRMLGQ
jgi:two-component system LytT family response regulator